MPRNSGQPKRDMLDSHGAGKGDADRSPKWREHYDEVEWGQKYCGLNQPGFESVGPGRIRKTYGPVVFRSTDTADWRVSSMECVKCGAMKSVNDFANPDECNTCAASPGEDFQPVIETVEPVMMEDADAEELPSVSLEKANKYANDIGAVIVLKSSGSDCSEPPGQFGKADDFQPVTETGLGWQ